MFSTSDGFLAIPSLENVISDQIILRSPEIQTEFINAQPFKHVVINDFLDTSFAKLLVSEFPLPPDLDSLRNEFGKKNKKHSCTNVRELGESYRELDRVLASDSFSQLVSKITGIPDLLYDPEYVGGGTHNNFEGQGMYPHVEFNYHPTTGDHRRLNAIVYLNEEWDESWGGSLELHSDPWDGDKNKIKSVLPSFNTCVLFETNEHSWHGFEKLLLPESKKGMSRKSFAIYMYTKERPAEEIHPKHATIYVQKPLSSHVVPGYEVTDGDVEEIKANFHQRNMYLKSLYERETKFITTIGVLQRQIRRWEENYRLPLTGFVRQTKAIVPPYADGWVERGVECELEALNDLTFIELTIRLPSKAHRQTIQLTFGDQTYRGRKQDRTHKTECHPLGHTKIGRRGTGRAPIKH